MNTRMVLAGVAVLAGASAAFAGHAVDFDENTGGAGFNNDQSVGWQFDVLTPVTVTHLSWYDDGKDGLSVEHKVGIWAPDGTLLTSVIVPKGTAASLDGVWRVVPVTSVTLKAGAGYIVGGYNGLSSTDRLASEVTHTVAAQLSYVDATFSSLNGIFERPTFFSVATTGFYGPGFNIQVPGPGAVALGAFAVVGAVRRRRV